MLSYTYEALQTFRRSFATPLPGSRSASLCSAFRGDSH